MRTTYVVLTGLVVSAVAVVSACAADEEPTATSTTAPTSTIRPAQSTATSVVTIAPTRPATTFPTTTALPPTLTPGPIASTISPTPAPQAIATPTPVSPTTTQDPAPTPTPIPTPMPAGSALISAFAKFPSLVSIQVQGGMVTITSKSVPNHPSPYFARTDSRYQAYNGTNTQYRQNPNSIVETTLVCRIPLEPVKAGTSQATQGGPIGVAINGIPFFNQYAAMNAPLTGEINSFDQYNGHPQQMGQYHYHLEPLALTQMFGRGALLGFLLDGFPVYGPEENGKTLKSADLDQYHGHSHATAEYPNGIYHYHVTDDPPYFNGVGYYGNPGTTTR